jgi:hypothetical protein
MKTARFSPGDLLKSFSRKQVLTKAELLQACGCSAMTAWRILHQQGYLTSYNHNAKYYTLARIARFDELGLWAYRDIRFSKWGTLPDTVLGQVELSAAGMTARELEELLHISNIKPTLTHLARQGRMQRAKIAGAMVYFVGEASRTVTYLLLRWLEDYGADLRGEYFPFDLPSLAFYRRGRQLHDWLAELTASAEFPQKELSTLGTITRHLAALRDDAEVIAAAERLEKAEVLFEELRRLLRLTSDPHDTVLHRRVPANAPAIAAEMEKSFQAWTARLGRRLTSERDADKAADLQAVLGYLEKYSEKLVGHVIPRAGRAEPFVVARTNNISEHRFGATKQGLRRKVGTRKLARMIQAMRPEELLIANLADPEYLEILCGGKLEYLPTLFAQNWKAAQAIRTERRKKTSNHPIPVRKKILREKGILPLLKQAVEMVIAITRGSRWAA